ncbi:MAG TPA: protein kinase, partial [Thermoanaerobaculia bacterium]|nr:protein kinase [Thermoanaerobaculia bacterium]
MTLAPGTRLGPYEILAPSGAGGMGEVYRGRDRKLDRDVAIKVLPESVAADPDTLARFEREAKAVAALSHPNILSIFDFGRHEGISYAVTELLEGETLREKILAGPIQEKQAMDYALQTARGLSAAHERGVVHRDLKPENLFVTGNGHVKILDFGLAKKVGKIAPGEETTAPTVSGHTEPGTVMGTVGYMSPEQVRGYPVDHRSDIFSFGALLYELLSGKRAFQRHTAADTMSAILKEEPPALAPGLPSGLAAIVARCLEKSPDERFQSARDLALDMKALERASEASVPVAAPARRRKVAVLGVAASLLLLALAIGIWMTRRSVTAAPGRIDSIAVLPLANLSGDREQDYFADGMTEALTAELAQTRSLKVISRTSVMGYKGGKKPLPDIARELGVNGIVEGSVLRAGNRVRITAQLIHAPTDRHLWARSYERDLRDVLTLQGEVARGIAREIKTELTPAEERRFARSRPIDPVAHEEYLRGRHLWNTRTRKGLEKSIEHFRRAIELEPAWGLAHAGLADAYQTLGNNGILPPKEAYPKARAGALKALELDPNLAEAHATLSGEMRDYEWDWEGSEREIKRALELNPSYAIAHQRYAFNLVGMGRLREAVAAIERARQLDPLSPRINTNVGDILLYARDYEGAAEAFRKAVDLDPGQALMGLASAHLAQGRRADAIHAANEWKRHATGGAKARLAAFYAAAGRQDEARRMIAQLENPANPIYVSPTGLALAYTALGEKERAINLLEKGFAERSLSSFTLKGHPGFDPLRSDPRFA